MVFADFVSKNGVERMSSATVGVWNSDGLIGICYPFIFLMYTYALYIHACPVACMSHMLIPRGMAIEVDESRDFAVSWSLVLISLKLVEETPQFGSMAPHLIKLRFNHFEPCLGAIHLYPQRFADSLKKRMVWRHPRRCTCLGPIIANSNPFPTCKVPCLFGLWRLLLLLLLFALIFFGEYVLGDPVCCFCFPGPLPVGLHQRDFQDQAGFQDQEVWGTRCYKMFAGWLHNMMR